MKNTEHKHNFVHKETPQRTFKSAEPPTTPRHPSCARSGVVSHTFHTGLSSLCVVDHWIKTL